jgi:DMSO/TMAO reductase YedYZ molybdopterin-dependent catalytic subunit
VDSLASAAQRLARRALCVLRLSAIPLVAGVLGSLAAIIVMGVLRLVWGVPTLPELVGERILPLLTVDQFIALLLRFSPNSKTIPLLFALIGQFILGILLGPAYVFAAGATEGRAAPWPSRRAWVAAGVFVVACEALTLLLFWPVLFGGLVGLPIALARLATALGALIVFSTFVVVTALANHWLQRIWNPSAAMSAVSDSNEAHQTASLARLGRREALGALGAVVVAAGIGVFAAQRLVVAYLARSNLAYEGMKTPYAVSQATQLTPNQSFYVVSKDLLDPEVLVEGWRLEVTGLVNTPRVFDYDQVRALPSEKRAITLECISNGVGGYLMSTAEWTGVSLQRLLAAAGGAQSSATRVVFYSVDGFTSSLPLRDLLEARTLLAYTMNGERLPDRHGFPLRVVTPGRYGEQSPKWLTRIEVVDHPYKGFYQSQGWSDRQLFTTSRIEEPAAQQSLRVEPQVVRGLAFAGIRGIRAVEVSADGGATWSAAKLIPPLSDQTWVYWTWMWTPVTRGAYTLVVRATDGTGQLQPPNLTSTVPNGATGLHRVQVNVL